MKNTIILIGLFLGGSLLAQDTFSLCAVDSITGEVGSAGASCLDNIQFPGSQGAIIISDVKPGVGVIHTQSYWIQGNQNNARRRMDAGDNAEEVIGWLVDNDVQNNPTLRQYGAALLDVDGRPSAKAFTGTNCADYKGQHEGLSYTVQGNILLGPEILDSMQARFIREKGDLAAKLMAAMQGANVPGADKRCLNEGVSSLSAFIRVAKPKDDEGNLYLDLNVPSTAFGVEPIDSLQNLYDQWRQTLSSKDLNNVDFKIGPNPFNQNVTLSIDGLSNWKEVAIQVADATGKIVFTKRIKGSKTELSLNDLSKGMFFFTVNVDGEKSTRVLKLIKI